VTAAGADPGGPLVALCTGHRCAALHRLAGTDAFTEVAAAVRATRGAVLVTTGCVDACDRGSVAGLASRAPITGEAGPAVWLAEVQTAERTSALVDWVTAGGPLPDCLRTALTALAAPRR
jgi:hypothetical protein